MKMRSKINEQEPLTENQKEVAAEEIDREEKEQNHNEQASGETAEVIDIEQKEVLSNLKKQVEDLKDTNLRLIAEFDNYRKRSIRERIELSKTASEEVIVDLLPIIDDFERAFQTIGELEVADKGFVEGIKLIQSKLIKTLSNKGLEEIQATGQDFDTDFHEAISQVKVEDESEKNKVIQGVQKGYKLHGKVIRFSRVIVGV